MIKCMIVDDERPARELIQHHLQELTNFSLSASLDNAIEAFTFLQQNAVDLIFIDIHMPKMSGLAFIKSVKAEPKVIFTTAYREYAVEAFELAALDYLVKPITRERFMMAVSKFNKCNSSLPEKKPVAEKLDDVYLFLKTGNQQTKIYIKDIFYIEGLKDFVKVHTAIKTFIVSERLSYMEQVLPERQFSRIHKSFIVALDKIIQYSSRQITLEKTSLPVGRIFKNEFLKKLP